MFWRYSSLLNNYISEKAQNPGRRFLLWIPILRLCLDFCRLQYGHRESPRSFKVYALLNTHSPIFSINYDKNQFGIISKIAKFDFHAPTTLFPLEGIVQNSSFKFLKFQPLFSIILFHHFFASENVYTIIRIL